MFDLGLDGLGDKFSGMLKKLLSKILPKEWLDFLFGEDKTENADASKDAAGTSQTGATGNLDATEADVVNSFKFLKSIFGASAAETKELDAIEADLVSGKINLSEEVFTKAVKEEIGKQSAPKDTSAENVTAKFKEATAGKTDISAKIASIYVVAGNTHKLTQPAAAAP